jgi:hypothetical protein
MKVGVQIKMKRSSRCYSTGCVVGVSDRRRFEGVPEGFVSFGWAFWSNSSMWLDGMIVSYINISSFWRLVGCECRSVHVGICWLVDPPRLRDCALDVDRNLPGDFIFVDWCV